MARITWQNVDAPNFSGVSDSYRTMSQLLGNATKSGSEMIDTYTKAQSDVADRAIQQRMMGITDPTQFDPTAVVGPNGGRASMAMLKAVEGQGATLVDRQGAANNMNWQTRTRDRLADSQDRMDASSTAQQDIFLAEQRGDYATADKIRTENQSIRALNAQEFAGVSGMADTYVDREQSRYNTGRNRDENAFQDSAVEDAEILYEAGIGVTGDAEVDAATVQDVGRSLGWSPERMQRARRGIGGGGINNPSNTSSAGTLIAGAVGGGSLPGGAADSSRVMNYVARGKGIQALPDSVQTMGNFADWSKDQNNKGMKETAAGTFQIVGSNVRGWGGNTGYAEKVFGKDWRDTPWTLENEDRVAEALFNDNKGSAEALKKQWVSLSLKEAEQLRRQPWEVARQAIARKESGADLSIAPSKREVANSVLDTTVANDQANAGNVARKFIEVVGNNATDYEVASQIALSFPGMSETRAQRAVQKIMADNPEVTPAQAGLLMLKNRPSMERSWFNPLKYVEDKEGNRPFLYDVDPDNSGKGGKEAVKNILTVADVNAGRADLVQQIKVSEQQRGAIDNQIKAIQGRIRVVGENPALLRQLATMTAKRAELVRIETELQVKQKENSTNTSKLTPDETAAKRAAELIAAKLAAEKAAEPSILAGAARFYREKNGMN